MSVGQNDLIDGDGTPISAVSRGVLMSALDVASEPMMITGLDHQILHVNRAFSELTGYTMEQLKMGVTPGFMFVDRTLRDFNHIKESVANGRMVNSQVEIRTKNGLVLLVDYTAQVVDTSHGGRYVVATLIDVFALLERAEQLRRLTTTDELTGALNRNAGGALLNHVHNTCANKVFRYSLILLDVDYLHQINEKVGLQGGDVTLQSVVKTLKNILRAGDQVVRWGGGQFLIVLPEVSGENAIRLAERLRIGIEQTPVHGVGNISASFGIAHPHMGEGVDELFKRAEGALAAAKKGGRNRVVMA